MHAYIRETLGIVYPVFQVVKFVCLGVPLLYPFYRTRTQQEGYGL